VHLSSDKTQADVQVISALVQSNPAAALAANKGGHTPFTLWRARAKNSSLDDRLEISRLLIPLDGADTVAIKSELSEICGKKYEEFDSAKGGVLQPEGMVQLSFAIKVSLARLQLAEDKHITKVDFVNACMRHVFDCGTSSNLHVLAALKHANAGLSSLRSLGEAYRLVQDNRVKGDDGTIKMFDRLVSILRVCANQNVSTGKVDIQKIDTAAQTAAEQRQDLRNSQRAIHAEVATIVNTRVIKSIESIATLPDKIKNMIDNRDIKRCSHVEKLRVIQQGLLDMAIAATKYLLPSTAIITTISDVEKNVMQELGPMKSREENLKSACNTAIAGIARYNRDTQQQNAKVGSKRGLMGAHVPLKSAQDGVIVSALTCYDKWVSTYLSDAHAKKTDTVMTQLKETLSNQNEMATVLGFKDAPSCSNDLEKALTTAGSTLAQERAHQLADNLGSFPSSSLMSAGKETLEAWQEESAALERLVDLYLNLEENLEMDEKCLNVGQLYAQKDQVIKDLSEASKKHAQMLRSISTLTGAIAGGHEDEIRDTVNFVNGFWQYGQDVLQEDLQGKLKSDIRSAYNDVTSATKTLAGVIQRHFPEVILFIGKGLPSELGSLWRPAQQLSLNSFDYIEQVEVAGRHNRHNLWKVKCKIADKDSWFAIKVYSTGNEDGLRTCLKEAAIIYTRRHHAIVEIVALFQSDDGGQFCMQMPWYEHGSLDKWVRSIAKPTWSKVRSVLLDALVGLSHLHDNKTLHCDIKPANILVDSRERGRLSDFDISVDTQDRTLAGQKRTSAGDVKAPMTTICATQTLCTKNFAAPELIADNKATQHTDMFAYGRTVEILEGYCEPLRDSEGHCEPSTMEDDLKFAPGQTAELIAVLTSINPRIRPSAKDAMQLAFFTILNEVNRKVTRECTVKMCGAEFEILFEKGIECGCSQFVCAVCIELQTDYVKKQHRCGNDAKVMCSKFKCTYEYRDLARLLPAGAFVDYLDSRQKLLKDQLDIEHDEHVKQGVRDEMDRLKSEGVREREYLTYIYTYIHTHTYICT